MPGELMARQVYRLYAVGVAILGGWTYLWTTNTVAMSTSSLGYSWLGIAVLGLALVAWMTISRSEVFNKKEARVEKFNRSQLTGKPLNLYAGIFCALAVVSGGAAVGVLSISGTILAYGWFATALYGAVLTVGLAARHSEDIQTAVSPTETTR